MHFLTHFLYNFIINILTDHADDKKVIQTSIFTGTNNIYLFTNY